MRGIPDTLVVANLPFQNFAVELLLTDEGKIVMKMTAVFMAVPEGYVGFVEELPGANTQGDTLDEARDNLKEAVQMVLEANRELAKRSIAGKEVSREPFDLTSP